MISEGEIRSWAFHFFYKHYTPKELENWKVFFLDDDFIQIMIRLIFLEGNYEMFLAVNR